MKNIVLLLPTCATVVGQEEPCATTAASPKKVITTKSFHCITCWVEIKNEKSFMKKV